MLAYVSNNNIMHGKLITSLMLYLVHFLMKHGNKILLWSALHCSTFHCDSLCMHALVQGLCKRFQHTSRSILTDCANDKCANFHRKKPLNFSADCWSHELLNPWTSELVNSWAGYYISHWSIHCLSHDHFFYKTFGSLVISDCMMWPMNHDGNRQGCHKVVTSLYKAVSVMLSHGCVQQNQQGCHSPVTTLSQPCCWVVTVSNPKVLQASYQLVTRLLQPLQTRLWQPCSMGETTMFFLYGWQTPLSLSPGVRHLSVPL